VFLKIASVSGAWAIDVQKIAGWVGGAPVYTSIAAKKAGKIAVDDAKKPKDPPAGGTTIGSIAIVLMLSSCSPSQLQQAAAIADDVGKIATVLCLADHARLKHAKAITVADVCQTIEQLAPYLDQAKGVAPKAPCAS
jgi:hypothetical protein